MAKKKSTQKKAAKKKATKKRVAKKSPAKKATTKKAASKKPVRKKKATRTTTVKKKVAKKKTAKKKTAKKKTAKKKVVRKKAAAKKVAKKKVTKKKAAAKKVSKKTTKRTPAKSSASNKAAAKKAAAKKPARRTTAPASVSNGPAAGSLEAEMEKDWTVAQLKRVKTGLKKKDLDEFLKLLLERRAEIIGNVKGMEDARNASLGDIAHMPLHMADVGSDNFEQEFTLGLMESEREMLREIEEAILRMREGYYGVCLETGRPIQRIRLEFAPWAKYCIDVARLREKKRNW
ncbi:MAG: TraR/DksA family transcriptional regulator [Phycisphaeraceae bacterium]